MLALMCTLHHHSNDLKYTNDCQPLHGSFPLPPPLHFCCPTLYPVENETLHQDCTIQYLVKKIDGGN